MGEKIILETGVRLLIDPIPHLRSVSMGIWVAAGSRLEQARERGISHFIEHMLFKGTRRRSSREIASEIDGVGGTLNGFTSREYSSFYAKVMDEHLPLAVDLLSDLYLESVFDPEELERERGVILQEIRMVEDTPEDHVMDLFHRCFWKGSPLGYPIQGDQKSISRILRDQLLDRLARHYHHRETLISISGHFDPETVRRLLENHLRGLEERPKWPTRRRPRSHPGIHVVPKDLEQVHVCLGVPAPAATHPTRYAFYILNTILGGGMSSRLFQEVRERRGLAYSIYSFLGSYADTGILGIYLGTTQNELKEALSVILDQMEDLTGHPLDEASLQAAREQIKGGAVLGMESSDHRMGRQARNELYFGRDVPLDEVFEGLERVTAEDVQRAAQKAFRRDALTGIILGKFKIQAVPPKLLNLLAR